MLFLQLKARYLLSHCPAQQHRLRQKVGRTSLTRVILPKSFSLSEAQTLPSSEPVEEEEEEDEDEEMLSEYAILSLPHPTIMRSVTCTTIHGKICV